MPQGILGLQLSEAAQRNTPKRQFFVCCSPLVT